MYKTATEYFSVPENESCWQYLKKCYTAISADVGDYGAFVNCDSETSMMQLFADVEKLAAFLSAQGFRSGDVLSVFLPTSANSITAFYALNKLGIITEFIHPLTPPAGVAEMMAKTGSRGLFILDRMFAPFAEVLDGCFTVVCSVSDYADGAIKEYLLADEKKNCLIPPKDGVFRFCDIIHGDYAPVADALRSSRESAVYMHGSGTTGKSKTVMLSSFALNQVAYKQCFVDEYHEYGRSYSLCVLPFFHAFGLGASLHYCICNAYTPVIMTKFDAEKANDLIKKYYIQYISGAPSMFMKMFNAPNFVNDGLKNLTVLYSGGDIVSEAFVERFNAVLQENGSRGKLFRGWGLTEMCAVCATNSHKAYRAESIGPIAYGLKVIAFDEDRKPLPANEPGEIALSGETMMNGYLPDSDTDGSGIYTDENGVEWICTGDMGYVDEDGFIFFTGRKKRIIVISGYNIYPYSIEQTVSSLPYVNEVCAVQGYDDNDRSVVKLCISLKDRSPSEELKEEIFAFCKEKLNGFSVPRKIVFMDALPRTKMDKLDFLKMSDAVPK